MDIYNYLKKDHRQVEKLFAKLDAEEDKSKRQMLCDQIREELTLHAETEEMTFYAAIEKAAQDQDTEEQIEHADEEHDEIRSYLAKLTNLPMDGHLWQEQYEKLKHAVTHHVAEEESKIFAKAKKCLSDEEAVQLAKKMDALKQKLKQQPMAA